MQFIESMTKIDIQTWQLRIWREEKEFKAHYLNTEREINKVVKVFYNERDMYTPLSIEIPLLIQRILTDVPGIEAIEAIDKSDGNGVIFYPDWK
jgi:hypothetical protein